MMLTVLWIVKTGCIPHTGSRNLFLHLTQQAVFGNPCHMAYIPATIRMACYRVTNNNKNTHTHNVLRRWDGQVAHIDKTRYMHRIF
jgi:hypothetical protein